VHGLLLQQAEDRELEHLVAPVLPGLRAVDRVKRYIGSIYTGPAVIGQVANRAQRLAVLDPGITADEDGT